MSFVFHVAGRMAGPYLAGGGGAAVIVGKSALFASRCPFSDAKSLAAAGCHSEPRTAPPPPPPPAILVCVGPWMGGSCEAGQPVDSCGVCLPFLGIELWITSLTQ